jgi:hypothetical protein
MTVVGKKSWVAYIGPAFGIPLCFAAVFFILPATKTLSPYAPAGLLIIALFVLARMVYALLSLKSYLVYADDQGVWITSGVFPWEKRRYGLWWRDLEAAYCSVSFWSWLLHAYTVTIRHRFTEDVEFSVTDIAAGDQVAAQINGEFASRSGLLQS